MVQIVKNKKSMDRLIGAHPYPRRHAVFQFRIESRVEAHLDVENLFGALVGDGEDDVAGTGFGADLIHDAAVFL